MTLCPMCYSHNCIKYGHVRKPRREQRYRCHDCGFQFILDPVRPEPIRMAIVTAEKKTDVQKFLQQIHH